MLGCSIWVSASNTLLSFSSCALNFLDEEKRASFQTTCDECLFETRKMNESVNIKMITSTPSSESMARKDVSMPGTSLYLISSRLFSHRPHGDSSVVSVSSSSVS